MNTQANAMPESPLTPEIVPPISAPRLFFWSVRRELWEHRSIYIAPLAIAIVILFAFLVSLIHMPDRIRTEFALDSMKHQELVEQQYNFVAMLFMGSYLIVAVFYCLDALHGERRDRSVLFWKSLPVSDLTTVLSKASIPIIVMPLLIFAITIATQLAMLLLNSAAFLASGKSVMELWSELPLFQMSLGLFFHLLLVHGFCFAPIYSWMLLVSAWARRAPFLWAVLPPFAIGIVEKIAFNTSHFAEMLGGMMGGGDTIPYPSSANGGMDMSTHLNLAQFLSSPGLWVGLLFAAVCLAGAVRLRRYRDPI